MFGVFLVRFRLNHNLRQIDIADALGFEPTYVCNVEKARIQPSEKFYQRFLDCYQHIFTIDEKADIEFIGINKSTSEGNKFLENFCMSRGINNVTLAKELSYSSSYIGGVRNGRIKMSPMFIKKFCNVYGEVLTDEERDQLEVSKQELHNKVRNIKINKSLFFSRWMFDFRMSRKMNQVDLATKLGTSITTISNIENGTVRVSFTFLERFLSTYDEELSEDEKQKLFNYFEEQSPEYMKKILMKFIVDNNLKSSLLEISCLSLEEADLRMLFGETLEKAREMSLKKGKNR